MAIQSPVNKQNLYLPAAVVPAKQIGTAPQIQENRQDRFISENSKKNDSSLYKMVLLGAGVILAVILYRWRSDRINGKFAALAEKAIKEINPVDKDLAKEIIPTLIRYKKKLKITNNADIARLLRGITCKNKITISKVLPSIAKNADDLKIKSVNDVETLLKEVTPENMDKVKLVANTPRAFEIKEFKDTLKTIKIDKKELLRKIDSYNFINNVDSIF